MDLWAQDMVWNGGPPASLQLEPTPCPEMLTGDSGVGEKYARVGSLSSYPVCPPLEKGASPACLELVGSGAKIL